MTKERPDASLFFADRLPDDRSRWDKHGRSIRGFKTLFQAGISQGLPGRYQAKQIRPGKPLKFPSAEIIGAGKITYLGGYLNPEAGGVKKIERTDPGPAGYQVFPEFSLVSPDRGDSPQTGNHYPPGIHG
jgi:hypothetical protein